MHNNEGKRSKINLYMNYEDALSFADDDKCVKSEDVKIMILPKELGKLYNKAFEYRQKFDYVDFAVPDREMVLDYIEKSKDFYNEIEKYLN